MGTSYTKRRQNTTVWASGRRRPSGFDNWSNYKVTASTIESITGTQNSFYNGTWHGGGVMFLSRVSHEYVPTVRSDANLQGSIILGNSTGFTPLNMHTTPSTTSLTGDGATAFARASPLNPSFDLATALGELRFGGTPQLPAIDVWRDRTLTAKHAGSNYLNVEFGWLPLINDVRDFASAVDNSDRIINAYKRDANHWISRAYTFPTLEAANHQESSFVMNPQGGFAVGGIYQSRFLKKWFEASYQYYLPVGSSQGDEFARYGKYARKLLNVGLTPDVLWNLSPWSWAADWFSNTGDVISNISQIGADGLLARHAYIMCHNSLDRWDHATDDHGAHVSHRRIEETKQRLPASPFGFNVAFTGLTDRQKAITAALGMSKW